MNSGPTRRVSRRPTRRFQPRLGAASRPRRTQNRNAIAPGLLRAFTLVELLVVIAVMGILASLLMATLSRSKDKAWQASCRNNLHELGLAFHLYHGDFEDQFPGPGSKYEYGPQLEDWIWWQYGREVAKSAIGKYAGEFNSKLFTCPADRRAKSLQERGYLPDEPYRYSYALTSYDLTNNLNPGLATIITQERRVFPFKAHAIRNPAHKLMLEEEDDKTIDDPRWVPVGQQPNLISPRHGGKGDVAFADGHIEPVTPQFGQNLSNSDPGL